MRETTQVTNNNNGVGCLGLIQVVLIIAKILNLVDWSWWVVLIPTWICIAMVIFAIAILVAAYVIKELK